ncbi:MAG: hypothetical protein ACXV5L_10435 [Thermoanaerobaculia bacterium]
MIIAAVVLFVASGIAMILARNYLAHAQSLFAGGSIVPGCVVAEAVSFFLLAAAILAAWRFGLL